MKIAMNNISIKLVRSLKTLGLSDYEARVYSALVHFGHAEAKELVNFLDISKPSVYSSLESLESKGLVLVANSKPAMYDAVSPEIAIKILMGQHETAAVDSLEGLKELEKDKVKDRQKDSLWTTYGEANIEHKIKEMLENARDDVICVMSDRYLHLINKLADRKLSLSFFIISDDEGTKQRVEEMFQGDELNLLVVHYATIFTAVFSDRKNEGIRSQLHLELLLELIVDDHEFFLVPPVGESIAGLYTNSKELIGLLKHGLKSQWESVRNLEWSQS
jgi:sugar-specific transcriptional regulator TrmB